MESFLDRLKLITGSWLYSNIIAIFAALFIPIIFLIFFPVTFFNELRLVDPYIYVGYGQNYADPSYLNGYYKISRLPYILVQYFYRNIFATPIAGYLLHFTLYSLSAYLIFRLSEKISNKFAAIVIAFSTPLLIFPYNGGADYHNTFSGVLFLALLLYIANQTLAQKDNNRWFSINVGCLYALVVHSNMLLSLNAIIYSLAIYSAIKTSQNQAIFINVIKKIALIVSGFLLSTLILCVINYAFGRHFLFMKPLWSFAISGGDNALYWQPFSSFINQSKHLSCFFALSIFSCFLVVKIIIEKSIKQNIMLFLINLAFIAVFCENILTQLVKINNLHMHYFTFGILTSFLITLSVNLGLIKSEKILKNLRWEFLIVFAIASIFFFALFRAEEYHHYLLNTLKLSVFNSYLIIWLALFAIIFLVKNNLKTLQFFILIASYSVVVSSNSGLFYSKNTDVCSNAKSSTDFYVEFNNHVKQYLLNSNRNDGGNIFSWMNVGQNINFNENCKNFYHHKINDLGISSLAGSSGFANPIDDPWTEGGMRDLDHLWKNKDGSDNWTKSVFLNYNLHPRVLVLISYSEEDVLKMIEVMKKLGLKFSLAETRKVFTDSFMAQYFILVEEGFKQRT